MHDSNFLSLCSQPLPMGIKKMQNMVSQHDKNAKKLFFCLVKNTSDTVTAETVLHAPIGAWPMQHTLELRYCQGIVTSLNPPDLSMDSATGGEGLCRPDPTTVVPLTSSCLLT